MVDVLCYLIGITDIVFTSECSECPNSMQHLKLEVGCMATAQNCRNIMMLRMPS